MRRNTVPALFCSICIPPTVSGACVFCPCIMAGRPVTSSAILSANWMVFCSSVCIVGMLIAANAACTPCTSASSFTNHSLRGVISQRPLPGVSAPLRTTICGPAESPALSIKLRTPPVSIRWGTLICMATPVP